MDTISSVNTQIDEGDIMSYFGNQGPPQDGGFIGGIARGSARLHNAKVTRARYQKGIGSAQRALGAPQYDVNVDTNNWRWVPGMSKPPSDSILYKRTTNFNDSYETAADARQAVQDGTITQAEADPLLRRYEADKQLISQWSESGPYIHERKAFLLGATPIVLGIVAIMTYRYITLKPLKTPKGHKSGLGAVFYP